MWGYTSVEQWAAAVLCVIAWSTRCEMSTETDCSHGMLVSSFDRSVPPLSIWRQQNENKHALFMLVMRTTHQPFIIMGPVQVIISSRCHSKASQKHRHWVSLLLSERWAQHVAGVTLFLPLALIKLSVRDVYKEQQTDDLGPCVRSVISGTVERMIWWFRPLRRSKGRFMSTACRSNIASDFDLHKEANGLSMLSCSWTPNKAL